MAEKYPRKSSIFRNVMKFILWLNCIDLPTFPYPLSPGKLFLPQDKSYAPATRQNNFQNSPFL